MSARGHLVFMGCDPAECRQYTNVQLNSLPLALFVARILKRTLVLPPFMLFHTQGQSALYRDDGHDAKNAYYRPFGQYFNVSELAKAADVVEWDDFVRERGGSVHIDHLWYETHDHEVKKHGGCPAMVARLLGASKDGAGAWKLPPSPEASGELLGARATIAQFQCGPVDLNTPDAFERWIKHYVPKYVTATALDTAPVLALLGPWWGSTNYADEHVDPSLLPPPVPSAVVDASLVFADALHAEADAFVWERLGGPAHGYASVHWRHGDYQQWRKHAPVEKVSKQALHGLADARVKRPWRVFLATNCPEEQQITELAHHLMRFDKTELVLYRGTDDLPRNGFLEQLIAARASSFHYSAASFFSQTIVRERRRRGHGPSTPMHGREQVLDVTLLRDMETDRDAEVEHGPLLPGGRRQTPIFQRQLYRSDEIPQGEEDREL